MLRSLPALAASLVVLVGCTTESTGAGGAGGAGSTTDTSASTGANGSTSSTGPTTSATSSTSSSSTGGLGPEFCPTDGPPVGVDVGDRLPSLEVMTCDDQKVSLDSLCGANGLWIFAAHGWCPLCQSVSSKQEAIVDEYAPKGLVAVNILVQDGQGNPSSAAFCKQWHETYGHEDVLPLYDPTGNILQLWPGGSSSLSAFVDKDRVIQSKLVHTADEQTIRDNLDGLFAP